MQQTEPAVATLEMWRQIYQAYGIISRCVEHSVAPTGLTLPQLLVLRSIEAAGAPLTPTRLAQNLGLETQSVTNLLDRLEHKGWVRRVRDQQDRRSLRLELTAAGATKLQEAWPLGTTCLAQVFAGLPPEEMATFTALFKQLARHVA